MIAMALCCNPKILIADEPTTALDVTMQAQILELMNDLKKKTDAAIILITHDLGIVARMADRIAVMYAGEIIETGCSRDVFYFSKHPYTWGLLNGIPDATQRKDRELSVIPGTPPDLFKPPSGCSFAARCEHSMPVCVKQPPPEFRFENSHTSCCWLHDERAKYVESPKIRRRLEEQVV